ncbi:uncharacterized protein TM35_000091500 [Trypanosoma theileri]|uniref:Uncharacterized protein n=1 Tax=Trypanosoma theileri TaxID=67003 RepID=A0A1X0P105_9TRYP|nr:uncharacterized protein TM35_000091500 [Trypanosoma theileri]ORC90100.1 hypothetical protein TM35_000091500 [Trypanosoma theileri]
MASHHSNSPAAHKEEHAAHKSEDTDSVLSTRRASAVREYIRSLPSVFEGDASPPFVDEMVRLERELAHLDKDELKRTVMYRTQRCNDALQELLEQERLLSDALGEVRHLELKLREKEEDMEMLRVQLQTSDDHIESLLREKADALRKLTDAKSELAQISRKAANLQRDLDAKIKREKELNDSIVSTPRTTPADAKCASMHSLPTTSADQIMDACRTSAEHDARLHREPSQDGPVRVGVSDRFPLSARRTPTSTTAAAMAITGRGGGTAVSGTTAGTSSGIDLEARRRSVHDASVRESDAQGTPLGQKGGVCPHCSEKMSPSSNNVERVEWRKLFFESQRQNKFLEKELAKARASNAGEISIEALLQSSKAHPRTPAYDLQTRLRRSMAELERVERELGVERERGRKQSQLEVQLLKDVGRLARKLRAHENAKSALRIQQRADASLTREELLEELSRCRVAVSALTGTPIAGGVNSNMSNGNSTSNSNIVAEADITAELAAALEEALAVNETLRAENDCVLADKKMREAAYEAELRNRIAEMDELTAALHELRDQMKLLKQQRPLSTSHISPRENDTLDRTTTSVSTTREIGTGKNGVANALQQREMPLHILSPNRNTNSKAHGAEKGNDDTAAP